MAFMLPLTGVPLLPFGTALLSALPVAAVVALVESCELKIDDNFLVGLGAPLLALIMHFSCQ